MVESAKQRVGGWLGSRNRKKETRKRFHTRFRRKKEKGGGVFLKKVLEKTARKNMYFSCLVSLTLHCRRARVSALRTRSVRGDLGGAPGKIFPFQDKQSCSRRAGARPEKLYRGGGPPQPRRENFGFCTVLLYHLLRGFFLAKTSFLRLKLLFFGLKNFFFP